jgi:hypothetical protein
MAFIKHVGKQGDRKVAILFRQVPDEEHMCLIVYPETLPAVYHDAVMRVLESIPGQNSEQFADELHRNLLPDGRNILTTLHNDGMIKKVQTATISITPNSQSNVRLDELNRLLNDMQGGNTASAKLAELDKAAGLQSPGLNRQESLLSSEALDDATLARNQMVQAEKMIAEAKGLLAEAERMKADAEKLNPELVVVDKKAEANAIRAARAREARAKAKEALTKAVKNEPSSV